MCEAHGSEASDGLRVHPQLPSEEQLLAIVDPKHRQHLQRLGGCQRPDPRPVGGGTVGAACREELDEGEGVEGGPDEGAAGAVREGLGGDGDDEENNRLNACAR